MQESRPIKYESKGFVLEQARYQEIANEIAHAIVLGEYHEGEKIHGRSTLAKI